MFLFRRQKFCNGNSCLRFSDCDLLLNKSLLWQKCTLRIAHFSSIYSMILISAFLWKSVCAIKHFKRDTNFSKEPLKLAIEEFILDLTQMRSQRKHRITFLVLFILDHQDSQKVKQNLHLSLWIIVDFTKFIIQEGNIINFWGLWWKLLFNQVLWCCNYRSEICFIIGVFWLKFICTRKVSWHVNNKRAWTHLSLLEDKLKLSLFCRSYSKQ